MSEISPQRLEAEQTVNAHILWSMGGGLIPFPLMDIAAVTAIQVDMLKQIADVYEVDFSRSHGKTYVTALAGSSLARLGASAIKLIPGVGSVIGGLSMSVLSGASTYGIGQVSIRHFESDGNLVDVDLDWAKTAYARAFETGKTVAEGFKGRAKQARTTVEALNELRRRRDSGEITPEFYETQKQQVLRELARFK
ncbi:MAG: DUF697 domain-containing protein [Bacteroidota bacterium]